jgi:LAGLIDADG DNA endonuclease family
MYSVGLDVLFYIYSSFFYGIYRLFIAFLKQNFCSFYFFSLGQSNLKKDDTNTKNVDTDLGSIKHLSLNRITSAFSYNDKEIKEIIFGSLLADAKLEMATRSKNARFGFIQSIHAKEYFLHLYSIFSHFCIANYRTYSYNDKRTQKTYISLNFFWGRELCLSLLIFI